MQNLSIGIKEKGQSVQIHPIRLAHPIQKASIKTSVACTVESMCMYYSFDLKHVILSKVNLHLSKVKYFISVIILPGYAVDSDSVKTFLPRTVLDCFKFEYTSKSSPILLHILLSAISSSAKKTN